MKRPSLLIFTEEFLSPSMTFIARQIGSLRAEFDVTVLTRYRRNQTLFPYEPLRVATPTFWDRLRYRILMGFGAREWTLGKGAQERIRGWIEELGPEIIHAHFGPSGLAILPIAQALNIPLIVTFHGYDASSMLSRSKYRRDLRDLFEYAEIVTVSQVMRENLIAMGADPCRTHCHYIGVPADNYGKISRESMASRHNRGEVVSYLQVSNFVEKKGHEFTVRAFAQLRDQFQNCELILAGDGPLLNSVKALTLKLGLEGCVHFPGHLDSEAVSDLMRSADCFVHHSVKASNGDTEGIPTVLMEAMASGLPVLSTRHAGIPELIEDGVEGLLVDERDVPAQVQAMTAMLSDDGEMGKAGRSKILDQFNIDACSEKLSSMFAARLTADRQEITAN